MESCLLGMETTESAPILCHNQAQVHLEKNLFDSTLGADVPGFGREEPSEPHPPHGSCVCVGEGVALPFGITRAPGSGCVRVGDVCALSPGPQALNPELGRLCSGPGALCWPYMKTQAASSPQLGGTFPGFQDKQG